MLIDFVLGASVRGSSNGGKLPVTVTNYTTTTVTLPEMVEPFFYYIQQCKKILFPKKSNTNVILHPESGLRCPQIKDFSIISMDIGISTNTTQGQ